MNKGKFIKWMGMVLTVGSIMILILLMPPGAGRAAPEPPEIERDIISETFYPMSSDNDDSLLGGPEIGVEYVNWYPGPGDLPRTDDDALSLYRVLGWAGWNRRFAFGNWWAWEEDWKVSWRGGTEHRYVDTLDLAYFSGHGGRCWDSRYRRYLYGPIFGNGGRNHDDPCLMPGDARKAYGDQDLEWVVFSACKTLENRSRRYWAAAMDGLHLILGFKTNMYDVNQGWHFGWRIRWRWRITQAWFAATDITHPHRGAVARVLADDRCHFRDKWGHHGCGDSSDWYYWWWDHTAGSEQALMVDPEDLNYEMPVLSVIAAAPLEEDISQISSAFGFSPETPAVLDENTELYRITEDSLDLTMDQQGMYYFADLDQLWTPPTDTMTLASSQPLASQDARDIADNFLAANNLLPDDAEFYEVVTDTLTSAGITEVPSTTISALGVTDSFTDVQETISSTLATNQQVIYSRHITYTPTSGDPITFSVQGPGARLKVYLDNTGNVIGAMGGWRTVEDVGILDTVQIITPVQMITLYQELGDMLNLAPTPFRADTVTVTRSTVGYYEQPLGIDQTSLTPVYVLDLEMSDAESGGGLNSTAFVPASPGLMNPLAAVNSYPATTPLVFVGDTLTLTAADASQPLSALGYGDNLNFTLGQAPYTYTWRIDNSGEVIGTGQTITHAVTFSDYANLGREYDVPLSVVLEVTDSAGNASTTERSFYFAETLDVQKVYLPTVLRQ